MDYVPQTALEKLNELFQSGFITEWEYNNRKKELGEDEPTIPTINSNTNSNNDYNNNSSTYDYNQVTPVTYDYNNNTSSASYDYNINTSSTYDYNNNNTNTNSTSSYDYNNVIPIINNDYQHTDDNYNNNYISTSSYDYNQVTPITYDYNTPTTTAHNNDYNNELRAAANERFDYYNNIEQTVNSVNSNNYHSYESVIEEAPIPEPLPLKVVPNEPKKSFVLPNKHINKEMESKVREYPLKVLNGYTMHKELGNNIVLYYKDKQGNHQSNLIPLHGKSKENIRLEIHKFIGLGEIVHSTIKVYQIILDEKRTTEQVNHYCTDTLILSKVLKYVNHNSDEILKPAHLLITFDSMGVHRSRWNPNSKITSSLNFTSVTDPFSGVKGEPMKIDRVKYPYVVDQFYPSTNLYAHNKFSGIPIQINSDDQSISETYAKNEYKADVHKDALWYKLNFLLLFRFLQNGSNKFGDLSLSNNSVINIMEPLKNSVACSKCVVCNEPSCFSSFLCNTHYSKQLVDAFENCKDYIFTDKQQKDHEEIKKEAEERQEQYKNETVFIKEKFAYIDPVNLLSIIKKTKLVPQYNFDE